MLTFLKFHLLSNMFAICNQASETNSEKQTKRNIRQQLINLQIALIQKDDFQSLSQRIVANFLKIKNKWLKKYFDLYLLILNNQFHFQENDEALLRLRTILITGKQNYLDDIQSLLEEQKRITPTSSPSKKSQHSSDDESNNDSEKVMRRLDFQLEGTTISSNNSDEKTHSPRTESKDSKEDASVANKTLNQFVICGPVIGVHRHTTYLVHKVKNGKLKTNAAGIPNTYFLKENFTFSKKNNISLSLLADIETVSQEFARLMIGDPQPKTRKVLYPNGKVYGIVSKAIPGFTSAINVAYHTSPQAIDQKPDTLLKQACLERMPFLLEIARVIKNSDLHADNFGLDANGNLVMIDGGKGFSKFSVLKPKSPVQNDMLFGKTPRIISSLPAEPKLQVNGNAFKQALSLKKISHRPKISQKDAQKAADKKAAYMRQIEKGKYYSLLKENYRCAQVESDITAEDLPLSPDIKDLQVLNWFHIIYRKQPLKYKIFDVDALRNNPRFQQNSHFIRLQLILLDESLIKHFMQACKIEPNSTEKLAPYLWNRIQQLQAAVAKDFAFALYFNRHGKTQAMRAKENLIEKLTRFVPMKKEKLLDDSLTKVAKLNIETNFQSIQEKISNNFPTISSDIHLFDFAELLEKCLSRATSTGFTLIKQRLSRCKRDVVQLKNLLPDLKKIVGYRLNGWCSFFSSLTRDSLVNDVYRILDNLPEKTENYDGNQLATTNRQLRAILSPSPEKIKRKIDQTGYSDFCLRR